jgi:hypothetical protein
MFLESEGKYVSEDVLVADFVPSLALNNAIHLLLLKNFI